MRLLFLNKKKAGVNFLSFFALRGGKISKISDFIEKNMLTRSDAYNIISQCGYV